MTFYSISYYVSAGFKHAGEDMLSENGTEILRKLDAQDTNCSDGDFLKKRLDLTKQQT